MKNLVFRSKEFGQIRTCTVEGETYFVGKDVASALGYKKPENAIATHIDEEDKTSTLIQGSGSNYKSQVIVINESGLYSLISHPNLIAHEDSNVGSLPKFCRLSERTDDTNWNRKPRNSNSRTKCWKAKTSCLRKSPHNRNR